MHSHAFCPSIHVLPDQFELVFYCSFDFIYFLYFKIITHSIRAHFSLRSSFQEYCSRFPASSSPHWGTYIHPSRYALFYWLDCPFQDRKSTRLNSTHMATSYSVFCLINENAE